LVASWARAVGAERRTQVEATAERKARFILGSESSPRMNANEREFCISRGSDFDRRGNKGGICFLRHNHFASGKNSFAPGARVTDSRCPMDL
jgi:hypothetical protein